MRHGTRDHSTTWWCEGAVEGQRELGSISYSFGLQNRCLQFEKATVILVLLLG